MKVNDLNNIINDNLDISLNILELRLVILLVVATISS